MASQKTLERHCIDGTFRSRRHHELLVGRVLPWPELAALQSRYAASAHELERRAIGVEFERAVRVLAERGALEERVAEQRAELEALLNAPAVILEASVFGDG